MWGYDTCTFALSKYMLLFQTCNFVVLHPKLTPQKNTEYRERRCGMIVYKHQQDAVWPTILDNYPYISQTVKAQNLNVMIFNVLSAK